MKNKILIVLLGYVFNIFYLFNATAYKQSDLDRLLHSSETDFTGADLSRANLSKKNLHGKNFTDANLQEAILQHANCAMTNFTNANLQGANLLKSDCSLANFNKANLIEAKMCLANLTRALFDGSELQNANLQGANLTKTKVFFSNLYKANLAITNCMLTEFYNSNLIQVNFTGAKLGGIHWSKTIPVPWAPSFIYTDLSGANFRGVELMETHFDYSILRGVDFSYIKSSTNVHFDHADLTGAKFIGRFYSIHLDKANLTNADFSGSAGLLGAHNGAIFKNTKWCDCKIYNNCPGK